MAKKITIILTILLGMFFSYKIGELVGSAPYTIFRKLDVTWGENEIYVFGLPFKGSKPHALDGTLRLFRQKGTKTERFQTSIPYSNDLTLGLREEDGVLICDVFLNSIRLLSFIADSDELKVIEGIDLIAPDPYLAQQQTELGDIVNDGTAPTATSLDDKE